MPVGVDDAARREQRPGARPETSAPARPNETSRPSGSGSAALSPTRAAVAPPLTAASSSTASAQASVAGPSQRSVHARLRTVSFTLEVVAIVAAGSKPEWIPQCSQRWSLPGPYRSHSIPLTSASYVGKMPSVSR